ncbi:hypothetical protein ACG7TL_005418 [Trametes sanguinea]
MLGVSLELPLTIRNTIPPSVLQGCLPRCPVETRGPDRHILFCPEALFPHRSRQVEVDEEGWEYTEPVGLSHIMEVIPRVGSFCQLVLPDNRRFTGRITRMLEYQQTRIILRVEHPYSPAIVTLAVPYPFYEGTQWWYIRLRRWFGYLTPDNNYYNTCNAHQRPTWAFPPGNVVAGKPPYLAGVAPIYGPADATTPAPATTIPPSAPNLDTKATAPAGNLPIPEDEEMDDGSAATSASSLPAVDYRSDNSDVLSTPSER